MFPPVLARTLLQLHTAAAAAPAASLIDHKSHCSSTAQFYGGAPCSKSVVITGRKVVYTPLLLVKKAALGRIRHNFLTPGSLGATFEVSVSEMD